MGRKCLQTRGCSPPSHGGGTGSNPVWAFKIAANRVYMLPCLAVPERRCPGSWRIKQDGLSLVLFHPLSLLICPGFDLALTPGATPHVGRRSGTATSDRSASARRGGAPKTTSHVARARESSPVVTSQGVLSTSRGVSTGSNPVWAFRHRFVELIWLNHAVSGMTEMPGLGMW
jgi:hypothetical protein